MVTFLIDKGLLDPCLRDACKRTCLHHAVQSHKIEIINAILKKWSVVQPNGAQIKGRNDFSLLFSYWSPAQDYIDLQDINWQSALMMASARESSETVQLLLKYKASITLANREEQTCLHIAVKHNRVDSAEVSWKACLQCASYLILYLYMTFRWFSKWSVTRMPKISLILVIRMGLQLCIWLPAVVTRTFSRW